MPIDAQRFPCTAAVLGSPVLEIMVDRTIAWLRRGTIPANKQARHERFLVKHWLAL